MNTRIFSAVLLTSSLLLAACATKAASDVRVPQIAASVTAADNVAAPAAGDPSALPPLPVGDVVKVDLVLLDKTIEIAPGIRYQTWTFNGTVPGPVIHAKVGQTIDVTLTNKSGMGHSIDFHSALAPPDVAYQTIAPGQSIHYSWVAKYPGVFLYHCGTPPVLMHISNGMYGAVVVDPQNGWPGGDAQSYVLVQSEFYTKPVPGLRGVYEGDMNKARTAMPDYVEWNGYAMQYMAKPLPIHVNVPVHLFVVNAGPSHFSAFHVIGTIFDRAWIDGNPDNELHGLQTMPIAPGDGALVEFTVQQTGRYPFVTHSFGDADLGAMGAFIAK
ncbi:MAG TPA: multicopper oxidase domain-containing protein [Candidatus Baltobacteraceae bacterium]|nr:multicopper oxidase domain-containing protein [Candidatus Baltobacteraceae bacterium]